MEAVKQGRDPIGVIRDPEKNELFGWCRMRICWINKIVPNVPMVPNVQTLEIVQRFKRSRFKARAEQSA